MVALAPAFAELAARLGLSAPTISVLADRGWATQSACTHAVLRQEPLSEQVISPTSGTWPRRTQRWRPYSLTGCRRR